PAISDDDGGCSGSGRFIAASASADWSAAAEAVGSSSSMPHASSSASIGGCIVAGLGRGGSTTCVVCDETGGIGGSGDGDERAADGGTSGADSGSNGIFAGAVIASCAVC